MSDKQFVDTNILVYSRDTTDPAKHAVAREALLQLWKTRTGVVSTQVCSEYFVTVTKKLSPGLPVEEAWGDVETLFAWNPVPVDAGCLRIARHAHARYGISWWDALIIAAASVAGCETILSEDLSHGQEYLGITVTNPFLALQS